MPTATCQRDTPTSNNDWSIVSLLVYGLSMFLTGTETIYDDLWSSAVYALKQDQYTVTYRTDVDEKLVQNVWRYLPMERLLIVDQYFDRDLDREVVILEGSNGAEA